MLDRLGSKFACSTTSTGHKLLPPCVRVIQDDGIDRDSLKMILGAMKEASWAADNLTFGGGGALLQKLHRDTSKCAFKCSYALVGRKATEVWKHPITDKGKMSKKGRMTLEQQDGKWVTVEGGREIPPTTSSLLSSRMASCWWMTLGSGQRAQ